MRSLRSALDEVPAPCSSAEPWDPVTLAAAAALQAVVTVAASVVPSIRAAKVNPIDALRAE
jgi:ABC-type lipoprotein release transport system permease subunit